MASNQSFHTLLSVLEELTQTDDHRKIAQALNVSFDATIKDIFTKWINNESITDEERRWLDLYSRLQLFFVERCFLNSSATNEDAETINCFPRYLFRSKQTDILKEVVIFVREEQKVPDASTEGDSMFVYLMRMLDARALAYPLCFKSLKPPPTSLNEELLLCLAHLDAMQYVQAIELLSENDTSGPRTELLHYRHQFFIGCCTLSVALFESNHQIVIKSDPKKYICALATYVRVMLKEKDFVQNLASVYCLRGIMAILTNCVPTDSWLRIINRALAEGSDEDARKENPFNREFFQLIIHRLIGSPLLRNQATLSEICQGTLLVDIALIFLNKWSDTGDSLTNDDDDAEENNNPSAPPTETNQVFALLRADAELDGNLKASQIIVPYIDAKYDRLRLMALATLSNIMEFTDFENLQVSKPNMVHDVVKLLFYFIDRAFANPKKEFKGISFNRLLRYLFRFLAQDVVKSQTITYVSELVTFARNFHIYALKILERISSALALKEALLSNEAFRTFFDNDASIQYESNSSMKKLSDQICRNLKWKQPEESSGMSRQIFVLSLRTEASLGPPLAPIEDGLQQAFISYCREETAQCRLLVETLVKAKLFTKIWLDENEMRGDMIETIVAAINQSKAVFVLLSKAYCESTICRREWEFAINRRIKVYHLIVQRDFKTGMYDWAQFNIGANYYYRLSAENGLKRMIDHIQLTKKTAVPLTPAQSSAPALAPLPPSTVPPLNESTVASNEPKNYLTKRSIVQWTSEDIREWCLDKNLEKWCQPLVHYHGPALLELRQSLAVESHLQHFLNINDITIFDVIRFRCELNQVVTQSL